MSQDAVLTLLREKNDSHLSGEEISRKLGVTRAAIWKDIRGLRALGYVIEAQPSRGYRLASVPDKMFADEISHGLKTKLIGKRILSFDEIDSTNDTAYRLAGQGAIEGTCVFAEFQKKGRGRLGRSWLAPKGENLLFSIVLRPVLTPAETAKITLTAAVSVVKAIATITGKTLGIKWPNDVYAGDRKVCGILTEMSAEADRVKFAVVGIGVNVNADRRELPDTATSLKAVAKAPVSRMALARKILEQFETEYRMLKDGRFEAIAREWEEFSVTSGRRVTATVLGRKLQGQAVGIDADGALWIRKDNGLQERVTAGDVELVR